MYCMSDIYLLVLFLEISYCFVKISPLRATNQMRIVRCEMRRRSQDSDSWFAFFISDFAFQISDIAFEISHPLFSIGLLKTQ